MVEQALIEKMTRNEADMAFKKRVQTIFEWVNPQDQDLILDLPCGRGFYLNMLRYVSQARLVGADLDWSVLQKARQVVGNLDDITLMNVNIYEMPYQDASFDAVILSEVLEHLDDDVRALKEAYRILKPGAVVAVTVPHANYPFWWDPINKTREKLGLSPIRKGLLAGLWANHVRLYQPEALASALQEAGFIIEEERSFTHYCFPFIHNLVYGLGKTLLEKGALPDEMASAADRHNFDSENGHWWNPINIGLSLFNLFDKPNKMNEPAGRSTVNLAIKGRKPLDV